jgi:hypothetical protein
MTMTEYIYKVTDANYEVWWEEDKDEILNQFGTVAEVVRYRVVDPEDVTDEVNGEYYRD